MAEEWGAYFGGDQSPPEDFSAYFQRAKPPEFASGLKKRMAAYGGLSPEDAAAKYRAGWSDTLKGIYNTITDPSKLAAVTGSAISAGANAVAHPVDTAKKVGNYYYENPDVAATDLAFAAFPGRQAVARGAEAIRPTASTAMPRAAIRDQAELLGTGGNRMNEAKLAEGKVAHPDLRAAVANLNSKLRDSAISIDPKLHPNAAYVYNRILNLVRAPKADYMSPMTKKAPPSMTDATMTELHNLRQLAQDVQTNGWNAFLKQPTSEGKIGGMMVNTIDDMIAKHPAADQFMMGKNEYARGMKSKSVMSLIDKAKNTTQWDRGDHAGAIRNQINSFLKSKDARYLTAKDKKELAQIKRYGFSEALGGQGSLSPMALTIGRVLEGMFGIPPGSLYIAGKLARENVNTAKPQMLERMAERIRAGE